MAEDLRVLEINVDDLNHGGVFAFVMNVLRALPEGIHLDVCAFERFEKPEHMDEIVERGGTVHYAGYEGNKILKQIACFRNLKALLRRSQYEVAHIHSDVAFKLLIYSLACRCAGVKKIILHSHCAGIDGNRRWIKHLAHRLCRGLLYLTADAYLACSDLASRWMYPRFLERKKGVVLVNNGIDPEKFRFSPAVRDRMRDALGLSDRVVFGHVGRFNHQKNHAHLIRLFEAISRRIPSAVLLLVGEGDLWEAVRAQADEGGLSEKIIFFGTSDEVEKLFQAMDVFLLPSRFEGLPIAGIEAQAAGLPSVFSSRITRSAKLTPDVWFESIDAPPETWMDSIEKCVACERKDTSALLAEAGFSSGETARRLARLYRGEGV